MSTSGSLASLLAALLAAAASAHAAESFLDERFDAGQCRFWASGGVELSPVGARLCADIPAGGGAWDRLVGVNDLPLVAGQAYRLALTLQGETARPVTVMVQQGSEPWTPQAEFQVIPSKEGEPFSGVFQARHGEVSQLILQLGGAGEDGRVCLDDVSLRAASAGESAAVVSGTPTGGEIDGTAPIRVNQTGYFTNGPKRATVISDAKEPLAFRLIDAAGTVLFEGKTEPAGLDPSAGVETHIVDFSAFTTGGEGYRLAIEGHESYPFAISDGLYPKLRIDALSWFYIARSGIEIRGDIAGEAYARPAGHVGVAPNRGDTAVSCVAGTDAEQLYGDWRCDYERDVSGGWYDAGDQGKYVVNGGMAVAQLMGVFERGRERGEGASPVLGDSLSRIPENGNGLSRIPENGNGLPDILDEARWELEFLLKMIVPDGAPLAGMAHHKVHDTRWTGVPMLPHLDPKERALHRPSTAATLNVAAAAAQGARLFAAYDADFSARLLVAARRSFAAAAENPVLHAPVSSGNLGGGDYADVTITDETYWAAAELFITTGEQEYLDALKASPHWAGPVFSPGGAFNWADTAGLGRLQLALYATKLDKADRDMIRASVVSAAADFLGVQTGQSFGLIYRPDEGKYDWGSNHLVLQNMIVVAAAYDLTGERRYLQAVRESMDYLLGRNAMNLSYVTGYGSVWSKNQHSRTFANQVDPSLPNPPTGSLAGGPNSYLVDDLAKEKLQGCAPQACYLDDIASWSTNELTINWNAPLVYIASFLADTR